MCRCQVGQVAAVVLVDAYGALCRSILRPTAVLCSPCAVFTVHRQLTCSPCLQAVNNTTRQHDYATCSYYCVITVITVTHLTFSRWYVVRYQISTHSKPTMMRLR